MLLSFKTVVLAAMVVVFGLVAIPLVAAPPPEVLSITQEDVAVGQILDPGLKVGDTCVMTHDALEVEVDVSVAEPSAGLTLQISDDGSLKQTN